MKNKFLESGEAGYHPLKKFRTIIKGLRYAVLSDFSVLYKVVVSVIVVLVSLWFHKWVDAALIIMATGFALSAELFNTAIEAMCD
ncbi:MAG TPA: diacylglycerol kinase, partial [Methylophaga sp.]|nr:diacylglycerol kinase [Methylophaga sp.]